MTTEPLWTLDELVRRVAAALTDPTYSVANGRVRELPDPRSIRWYTTIGLVDRPAGMRGRNALYGARHLLQVTAIKRRQSEGCALADIQAELAGATDKTLRRIAAVPTDLLAGEPQPQPERRRRFWTTRPTAADVAEPAPDGVGVAHRSTDTVTVLAAVELTGGAVIVLPHRPDDDDVSAIHAAARPLLDLLADRGLLTPDERSPA
jgi:DNA-binding transcriptional MerR regulator